MRHHSSTPAVFDQGLKRVRLIGLALRLQFSESGGLYRRLPRIASSVWLRGRAL